MQRILPTLVLFVALLAAFPAPAQHGGGGGDSSSGGGFSMGPLDTASSEAKTDKAEALDAYRATDTMVGDFESYDGQWRDNGCEDPAAQGSRICNELAKSAAEALRQLDEHIASTTSMYEQSLAKYTENHNHTMRRYMQKKLSGIKEYEEEIHKTALYSYLKSSNLIQ